MQALWMLVAALFFACMGTCVKLATAAHSVWEIVFYRNLIGLLVLIGILCYQHGTRQWWRVGLLTPHWRQHATRNLTGTIAVVLWFSATAYLPLATAMTLNYTSSLFIAAIVLTQNHLRGLPQPSRARIVTLLVGFLGVCCVLRPTFSSGQIGWALGGLLSGLLAGIALLTVRDLGRLREPETRTVFYFSLSGVLIGGMGMLLTGIHPIDLRNGLLLIGVGIFAVLAQLALTRAYGSGKTILAASLHYAGILFASLFGILIWHDVLPWIAWLGMLLIIVSGCVATWQAMRAAKSVAPHASTAASTTQST